MALIWDVSRLFFMIIFKDNTTHGGNKMIRKRKIDQLENKFFAMCDDRQDCHECPYDHYGDHTEDCRNGFIAEKLQDYVKGSPLTFKILREVDPLRIEKYVNLKRRLGKNNHNIKNKILHTIFFLGGLALLQSIDLVPMRILFEGLFMFVNYEFMRFKSFADLMCFGKGSKSLVEIHECKVDLVESILENNIESLEKKLAKKEGLK